MGDLLQRLTFALFGTFVVRVILRSKPIVLVPLVVSDLMSLGVVQDKGLGLFILCCIVRSRETLSDNFTRSMRHATIRTQALHCILALEAALLAHQSARIGRAPTKILLVPVIIEEVLQIRTRPATSLVPQSTAGNFFV